MSLLRTALLIDAAVSGTTGTLMFFAARPLAGLLGIPVELLRWTGLGLLPFAAFLVWLARDERISRPLTIGVVAGNVIWAAGSLLLLAAGWLQPTPLGFVFVIGQAAVVGSLAELEYVGLRRSAAALA